MTHSPCMQCLSLVWSWTSSPPHCPHTSMNALSRLPAYWEVGMMHGLECCWVANGFTLNMLAEAWPGHVTTPEVTPPCTYIIQVSHPLHWHLYHDPQSACAVFIGLYNLGPSPLLATLLAAPTLPWMHFLGFPHTERSVWCFRMLLSSQSLITQQPCPGSARPCDDSASNPSMYVHYTGITSASLTFVLWPTVHTCSVYWLLQSWTSPPPHCPPHFHGHTVKASCVLKGQYMPGLDCCWVANCLLLNNLAQAWLGHVTTLWVTPPCMYIT